MKNSVQILQFTLHDASFGCDVTELEQILSMMTLEIIPNAPPYLQGMMNLNGTLIPVFNLSRYLKLKPLSYDLDTSILLAKTDGKPVGFIVDRVIDLFHVERNAIQQDGLFKEKKSPYLGNIVIDDKPCLIVQFQRIINDIQAVRQ